MSNLLGLGVRAGLQSLVMFMLMHGLSSAETSAMMFRLLRDGVALVGFLLMQVTVG